ncbi:hypothetical protein B0H11DRAFT_960374 [Mycena galericulata]|nr:hypothetical protein B0H11DRAFT_960374 [Mycena galericulata]
MADFNFVLCGIATIAATVGYACVRKSRPLPSRGIRPAQHMHSHEEHSTLDSTTNPPMDPEKFIHNLNPNGEEVLSQPESEATVVTENSSLKRKRVHDQEETEPDLGYPENLKSIYPNKRRSGSVSDEESAHEMTLEPGDSSTTEEPHPAIDSGQSDPVSTDYVNRETTHEMIPGLSGVSATEEPHAAPDSGSLSPVTAKRNVVEATSSPGVPKFVPIFPDIPRFVFPQTPPRITARFPSNRSKASPGFANFAGSSTPFLSLGSADSRPGSGKPVWASLPAEAPALEAPTPNVDTEPERKDDSLPALAALKSSTLGTQTHLTGEEDEDVTLELKGVKLFVKRGEDNFLGGMVGHIKLLSHKTGHSKRLLFRREPLWKVSMNVRLQPTVRCTFDVQENILRIALKELDSEKLDSEASQTVIYAFKPGRSCRRGDFQEFAESLLAQARQDGQS